MDDPMFSHLSDATYALIGHEKEATEDLDAGLFSDRSVTAEPDIKKRVKERAERTKK